MLYSDYIYGTGDGIMGGVGVRSGFGLLRLSVRVEDPPGLEFSPSAVVSNMTRLGNRSMLCRATALSKKSHHLRMVVLMLSQHVTLRAFAYDRWRGRYEIGAWSQLLARGRTWLRAVRSLAKCSALRVHVTHPYSRVSITSACSNSGFQAKRGGRHIPQLPGRTVWGIPA